MSAVRAASTSGTALDTGEEMRAIETIRRGLHHSPEHWQDPETFRPERFTKENKEKQTPFSHLPFGGGPRVCIGRNYATMQMLMILSVLLRNFDFELIPNRKIEMHPMVQWKVIFPLLQIPGDDPSGRKGQNPV